MSRKNWPNTIGLKRAASERAPRGGGHRAKAGPPSASPLVATVEVRCVKCRATREIVAGELGPMDFPMCERDGMPMLVIHAHGF